VAFTSRAGRADPGHVRPIARCLTPSASPDEVLRGTRFQDEKQVNAFPRFLNTAAVRRQRLTRRAAVRCMALCIVALLPACVQPSRPGGRTPKHEKVKAAATRHTVEKGDTLWGIAKLYGVKPIDIVELNNIKLEDVAKLEVGRKLLIPETDWPGIVAGLEKLAKRQESGKINSEPYFVCPVTGPIIRHFNDRTEVATNYGIDIRTTSGANVVAAKSGVVIECTSFAGWGNIILIDHGSDEKTFYAHLSAMKVAPGDHVKQRQVIGRVGTTGRVTSPTLHFRIYRQGKPVDPRGRFSF